MSGIKNNWVVFFSLALLFCMASRAAAERLVGYSALDARTLAPGPPAGRFLDKRHVIGAVDLPFTSQPVLGISSASPGPSGTIWALTDNGFGDRHSSKDFLLRIYRLAPSFIGIANGSGKVRIVEYITLSDPAKRLPFRIVADEKSFSLPKPDTGGTSGQWLVESEIRERRLLTGYDLDPESMVAMPDGSFWIGDESGPYLLHFNSQGELTAPPYPVSVPSEAVSGEDSPQAPVPGRNLIYSGWHAKPRDKDPLRIMPSKGIEALSASADSKFLYLMLEGPLEKESDKKRLLVLQFDVSARQFTRRFWHYQLEREWSEPRRADRHKVGDMTLLPAGTLLVLEGDDGQGQEPGMPARFKKVFAARLDGAEPGSVLSKRLVADLLSLSLAQELASASLDQLPRSGNTFKLPFLNLETLMLYSPGRVLIINDNNYPTAAGSARAWGLSDNTELALLEFDLLAAHH